MTPLIWIVSFIALIVLVVGIHEAGHFVAAKASGIRVDEFAIGFGPRIWQRRRGETVYSVRALPLGGFVKMPGMSALEQDTGGERGFMAAKTNRKVAVLLAGVFMNFVFAGFAIGLSRIPSSDSQVSGALARAGLQNGDVLLSAAGQSLDPNDPASQSNILHAVTLSSLGQPIDITYRATDGSTHQKAIAPQPVIYDNNQDTPITTADGSVLQDGLVVEKIDGQPVDPKMLLAKLQAPGPHTVSGHALTDPSRTASGQITGVVQDQGSVGIGQIVLSWRIGYAPPYPGQSFIPAVLGGVKDVPGDIKDSVVSIWQIFTTPGSGGVKNFSGPVGIAHVTSKAAQTGFWNWIYIVGQVSLSLGIINVLPIPPFDGGRLVMVIGEAVSRRRLRPNLEFGFIAAGVLAIVTLAVFITLNDIRGLGQ